MIAIQSLLTYCATKLAQIQNGQATAESVVDFICQRLKNAGYGPPSSNELAQFLTAWKTLIQMEVKAGVAKQTQLQKRVSAIELIEYRNQFPWNTFFANVHPQKFALELAIRLRRPRDIDQGQVDFCGQASILYRFAKDEPEEYTSFCLDLLTTGVGQLRQAMITPSVQIRASAVPQSLRSVDYVPLASIRDALDVSHVPGVFSAAVQGTQPQLLVGLLRKMGCLNVVDRVNYQNNLLSRRKPKSFEHDDAISLVRIVKKIDTYGVLAPTTKTAFEYEDSDKYLTKLRTLQEAQAKLAQNHLVIIAIDPDILQFLGGGRMQVNLSEGQYLHYVPLLRLALNGQKVDLKIFSWGTIYQGNQLWIHDFLPRFSGYVSAQM